MTARVSWRFLALFLGPALILYTVFVALPALRALLYSLQRWSGFGTPEWVGLDNFARVMADSTLFLSALSNNVFLLLVSGAGVMGLALLFASLIHRRIRGAGIFRAAFFFPNVLAAVAVALLWMLLYSTTEFGLINAALIWMKERTGLPPVELPYAFTDSRVLIYALAPVVVWQLTGFYMVLFLAAMENIPESLYEAARLEGASAWEQFRRITLPLIREVLAVGGVFFIITSLKLFDLVWVFESQYPTPDSHVMATVLYQKVFSEYDVGYGAAVAVILFVLVFLLTLATLRISRKEAIEF